MVINSKIALYNLNKSNTLWLIKNQNFCIYTTGTRGINLRDVAFWRFHVKLKIKMFIRLWKTQCFIIHQNIQYHWKHSISLKHSTLWKHSKIIKCLRITKQNKIWSLWLYYKYKKWHLVWMLQPTIITLNNSYFW